MYEHLDGNLACLYCMYACLTHQCLFAAYGCVMTGKRRCRWIERYNNKLRQPAKKEEARRMKQFVNDAFAQDPRILQRRAEEKAQR